MFSIFNKTKDNPRSNLIRLLKKNDFLSAIQELIEEQNTEDIGPSTGFKIMVDEDFDFLEINERIALDYINRVGVDNKNLVDKVWTNDLKKIATYQIALGFYSGISLYSLVTNLEKIIDIELPKDFLINTIGKEISYEYSRSKIDTLLSELSILPNARGYVKIELSPAHKEKDICDYLQGTYKVEDAPLTPFHLGCNCRSITFLDFKDLSTTTIEENLKGYSGDIDIDTIETSK